MSDTFEDKVSVIFKTYEKDISSVIEAEFNRLVSLGINEKEAVVLVKDKMKQFNSSINHP